jgi:hypothetical protein
MALLVQLPSEGRVKCFMFLSLSISIPVIGGPTIAWDAADQGFPLSQCRNIYGRILPSISKRSLNLSGPSMQLRSMKSAPSMISN